MKSDLVARVIASQFPQLVPVRVEYLGEGYDSTAFVVDGEWVFRFPKRREVEQQLLTERRILAVLMPDSPVAVPDFSFNGKASDLFPMEFAGYRMLSGIPGIGLSTQDLDSQRLAGILAEFLSFLHSFPTKRAIELGATKRQYDFELDDLRADALSNLAEAMTIEMNAPYGPLSEFLDNGVALGDRMQNSLTLVHGDLAAEHILVDSDSAQITGIIDWTEVGLGDPAIDFAGIYHWGGPHFLSDVLTDYRGNIDGGLIARARYFAACKAVDDIIFGGRMDRPEYMRSGIRAIGFLQIPRV